MKRTVYTNILFLFVYFTIFPSIIMFIGRLLFKENNVIGFAPFLLSMFVVSSDACKYYKKEDSFIRVVFLAVAVALLIEIFCLWGFMFFPKLALSGSLLTLDGNWIYVYWISQFCLISLYSVTVFLLGWKEDPKLSRRVGILGIIIGILIFLLILICVYWNRSL